MNTVAGGFKLCKINLTDEKHFKIIRCDCLKTRQTTGKVSSVNVKIKCKLKHECEESSPKKAIKTKFILFINYLQLFMKSMLLVWHRE